MYFRPNLPLRLSVTFFIFLAVCPLFAQDDAPCELPPPEEVFVIEESEHYIDLYWTEVPGATAYDVAVIDSESGNVVFHEVTPIPAITITDIYLPSTTIGIASVCPNGQNGNHGYVESTTTIIVQDIVMQLDGERAPRTMKCDAEKVVVDQTLFSGSLNKSVTVTPPFNPSSTHPINGAIVEVTLKDLSANQNTAVATMVLKSNSQVLNAAVQENVVNHGLSYEFIQPATHPYFDLVPNNTGEFDFILNTIPPTGTSYLLTMEQRNCINTRVVRQTRMHARQAHPSQSQAPMLATREGAADPLTGETEGLVFPNPAHDMIYVKSTPGASIHIRNSQGQLLYHNNQGDGLLTISIDNWPAGMYLLETLDAAGQSQRQQFLKQ